MASNFPEKQWTYFLAILLGIASLTVFLIETEIVHNPIILFVIALFILFPYRRKSKFVSRFMLLAVLLFSGWLLSDIGFALMPFGISFLLAYLLDPFVKFLQQKGIPRWSAAMIIVLLFVGAVTAVAVFVFPLIFNQLDSAIERVSTLMTSVSTYFSSDEFYEIIAQFGINEDTVRNAVEDEVIPRLEGMISSVLGSLSLLLQNLSGIATQLVNAILIPVLAFYFLKDFNRLKDFIKNILRQRNKKFLYNLRRINRIFRIYISWQATAALIVATVCSIAFTAFGVPYGLVLGIICGFLNPIPYLGVVASLFVSATTVVLVNPEGLLFYIIIVVVVISVMHFINAYFLEPNIAGKQVGLHPLLLIASLFVFGDIFGFVGLLIAVPCTATMMMFFNDWREQSLYQATEIE